MALIFLCVLFVLLICGLGAMASVGVLLKLFFELVTACLNGGARGAVLFFRLTTWAAVRLIKLARALSRWAKRRGLWAAQHAYVWLFVWSYRLRTWYVSSELRKRTAH